LQHIVDRVEAGLGDVLAVEENARRIEIQRIAPNARPGDDDFSALRRRSCRRGGLADVSRRLRSLRLRGGRSTDQRRKSLRPREVPY
jgi:hypothetical protein